MTEQIKQGTALFQTQGPFWPAFVDSIKGSLPVNTATPWQPTGGLGITTQYNMFMWFDQGDDPEAAVIIRLPDTEIAKYMGLQLSNFWGSSADWANRHVSMNWGLDGGCQAEQSAPTFHPAQHAILDAGGDFCGQQDAYFIVLSAADPDVKNWIETAELSEGLLAGRLQSVDAPIQEVAGLTCNLPVAIPVPGPDGFPFPTDLATRVQIILGQIGATATPSTIHVGGLLAFWGEAGTAIRRPRSPGPSPPRLRSMRSRDPSGRCRRRWARCGRCSAIS
jgi:hypothetical protein